MYQHERTLGAEDLKELENIMLCAKWLIVQFENLDLLGLARLFQNAVSDAEAWIENMIYKEEFSSDFLDPVKDQESKAIYNILVKYASIGDPEIRKRILSEMSNATEKKYH